MSTAKAGQSPKKAGKSSILRSSAHMSLGTLASRILGLVRDQVISSMLPAMAFDAFVAAFRLPNFFRRLLGEGALSVSFIPVYVSKIIDNKDEADQLAGYFLSLVLVVSAVVSALGVLFMPNILGSLVSGEAFLAVEGKLELTIFLARLMFTYLFLVSSYSFLMALSQAHHSFFLPALAPALFNVAVIGFALIPYGETLPQGTFLAIGVLVGGVVQVGLVFISLRLKKIKFKLNFNFKTPVAGVSKILKNMVPGLMGMGVLQLMGIANLYFASNLPEGTISSIYLADRILEFPQSLIAISMGAALLPTLSRLWTENNVEQLNEALLKHIHIFVFLALPSAVGMYLLSQPIVEVLFMRKSFTADSAAITSSVVEVYGVLLIVSGLNKLMVPSFYAIQNTLIPAVTSACSLILHLMLAYFFIQLWGVQGLIISMVCSSFLNAILLQIMYKKHISSLNYFEIFKKIIYLIPALALMALSIIWSYDLLNITIQKGLSEGVARGISLFLAIGLAIIVYFLVNALLRNKQALTVLSVLKKRR